MEHQTAKESPDSVRFKQRAQNAFRSFSLFTKAILMVLVACFFFSGLTFAYLFNERFKVNVPETGGTLKEGVVGFPKSVNPLSATNQTDKDIAALVFSGLLREKGDGSFSPELAQSYSLSADGRTYDFILKNGIQFQDGSNVTADDVIYTIIEAQKVSLNPELAALWQGVQVLRVKNNEVKITLPQPSNSFLKNFTLGVLSRKKYTGFPVGSGPYKIKNIKKDIDGMPQYYELIAFKNGTLRRPYISSIVIRFYANEKNLLDGFRNNEIDSASGISLSTAKLIGGSTHISSIPTDRVFGIFFNEKSEDASLTNTVLSDPAVWQALSDAVDRSDLVRSVFGGIGLPLYLPVPTSLLSPLETTAKNAENVQTINGERLTDARAILHQAGWTENSQGIMEKIVKGKSDNVLSFSLNVPNVPTLVSTAEYIKTSWAKIGVDMNIKVSDNATFLTDILKNKKYDAVLFGEEVGDPVNLSPFWHTATTSTSSLSTNASLYSNKQTDALLNDAEATTSADGRTSDLQQAEENIMQNLPAIFLYQPAYTYVLSKEISVSPFIIAESPEQRFDSVREWHIETERVWNIFAENFTANKNK